MLSLIIVLAWTPLQSGAGFVVSWPAEAWPLEIAAGPRAWSKAATDWSQVAPVAFTPLEVSLEVTPDGKVAVAELDEADWMRLVGDENLVGFTLLSTEEGTLLDADVLLNGRFQFSDVPEEGAYHRETILRHELGHVIGLGHACGEGLPCDDLQFDDARRTALMHPRQEPGVQRVPGEDDVDGAGEVSNYLGVSQAPTPARDQRCESTLALEGGEVVFFRRWEGDVGEVAEFTVEDCGISFGFTSGTTHVELWTD